MNAVEPGESVRQPKQPLASVVATSADRRCATGAAASTAAASADASRDRRRHQPPAAVADASDPERPWWSHTPSCRSQTCETARDRRRHREHGSASRRQLEACRPGAHFTGWCRASRTACGLPRVGVAEPQRRIASVEGIYGHASPKSSWCRCQCADRLYPAIALPPRRRRFMLPAVAGRVFKPKATVGPSRRQTVGPCQPDYRRIEIAVSSADLNCAT